MNCETAQSKRFLGWLGLLLIMLLFLTACSSDDTKPEKQILGKWLESGGAEQIEFLPNGDVQITQDGQKVAGSYAFSGKDQISFQLGGHLAEVGPIVAKFSLSGKELVMDMPDGATVRYGKIE